MFFLLVDVYPSDRASVLVSAENSPIVCDMNWGFPGHNGNSLLINARAETALEKKTFKESVMHRRCVIPAGGFYEWNWKKEKFSFRRMDHAPLLFMAGCFNLYDGKNRFVILTTHANVSMEPVHDRMPMILERNEIEDWLSDDGCAVELLQKESPLLERSTDYEQMSLF